MWCNNVLGRRGGFHLKTISLHFYNSLSDDDIIVQISFQTIRPTKKPKGNWNVAVTTISRKEMRRNKIREMQFAF